MADAQSPPGDSTAALQPDVGVVIPRMRLGEQGYTGLRIAGTRIYEEVQAAFRYPAFIQTVYEMRNNPTVGGAMNVYRMMMSRVRWDVEPPPGATVAEKARAAAVKSMMDDMVGSWSTFIEEVIPYLEFGYDVHEMVMRRRLYVNGSKYNDGIVGIKKLAPRAQETIAGWVFSDDGSDLVAIRQSTRNLLNSARFSGKMGDASGMLEIDRSKCLLFRASATKGNPEGNSIYKNIYLAFKQLSLLQDQELLGIAKDVQGLLKIAIPPQYMSPDASPEEQATFAAFQAIIDNYNAGTQRGLLVPMAFDPTTKQPLFQYEMLSAKGVDKYDVESVIKRLQGDILSALSVDILKLGSNGTGSFSLAESKSSVLALAIDYRLREIAEVLNSELMALIYQLNGWDATRACSFVYKDVEEMSLEEFSKAVQRVFSTSAIEMDRAVMNRVRASMGIPELPVDAPIDKDALPGNMVQAKSAAGAGMAIGTTGEGTAQDPFAGSGQDKSSDNNDNAG